jgi:hypothetical protein
LPTGKIATTIEPERDEIDIFSQDHIGLTGDGFSPSRYVACRA